MTLHLPSPMLAEVDMGQVIMVIVFLAVAFINWLINLWKQKQEEAERSRRAPTQGEMEHNRRILEEHASRPEPIRPAPVPPPSSPAGGGSLKELFEELKRAAEEAKRAASPAEQEPLRPAPTHERRESTPPPLAPPVRRPSPPALPPAPVRTSAASHGAPLPLAPKVDAGTHAEATRKAAAAYSGTKESQRKPHPLTALLHSPEGYRQAFVLKEVLDTPKGLRKSPWNEEL